MIFQSVVKIHRDKTSRFRPTLDDAFMHLKYRVTCTVRSASSARKAILVLLFGWLMIVNAHAAPPPGYYLVWSDEFTGSALDTTKWGAFDGPNRDGYCTPAAATVSGGNLSITTYTTNGTHYSAILTTDGAFRYRYGYLEASIDFDTTAGMWSGLWLQSPTQGQYIGDPSTSGAEIDICEHRNLDANNVSISGSVQSTIHWDGYFADHKSVNSGLIGSGLGTGFHSYGLLWDRTNYSFQIDGTQLWTTTSGHSDHTEVILLSSEVQNAFWAGSVPPGGYGSSMVSTTKMVVDYVRYYAPSNMVFWSGATSGSWASNVNWVQSRMPGPSDEVVFSVLSTGNFNTSLTQDTSIGGLSIQEPGAVSIGGNSTLTINSLGIDMVSAINDATINSAVNLGAPQTWRIAGGRTLTVNGVMTGAADVVLNNRGVVALMAANTHSGAITVSNGTLLVSGTTGTNTIRLTGGTLSGGGTVAGPLVVGPGGNLASGAPGHGIGTLTVSNNLTLQAGGSLSIDVNKIAGACDKLVGVTTVTFGGLLSVSNLAGILAPGDAFKLVDAQKYQGVFAKIIPLTPGSGMAWDTSTLTNDGTLRVMSTVPANIIAQITGGGTQCELSWPIDHTGWRLQVQTNSPGSGLGTNWVLVSDSIFTNRLVIPIAPSPSVGSVFYRLVSPPFSTSPFSKNSLVALLVGNGSIGNLGAPGFINEYSPAGGACLSQLPIQASGAGALVFGPSAFGCGMSRSPNGRSLVIAGYNTTAGSYSGSSIDSSSTTVAPAVPRAIGTMDVSGNFALATTTTLFSGSTIRSSVTDGLGNFWAGGGAGGIQYLGTNSPPATVSSSPSGIRNLGYYNGNLYVSAPSQGVLGFSGAPKFAATPTLVLSAQGIGTGNSSPKGFTFNSPPTIAYVADIRSSALGGGIYRFNWTGTAWVYAYTLAYNLSSSTQVWELIADFSGPNPILYATTGEATENHLVSVTDTGAGSAYTILATAPPGDAFRGIAFAPVQ